MKFLLPLALCCFIACRAQTGRQDATDIVDQETTIETHVISRGRYQYVLVVEGGPHAGKYLPEKELPPAYCQDKLSLKINARILDKKGIVYKPGPTDIPERNFELPVIRIKKIRKNE